MEAFEIGISLALKDGVADGVAVARRDMQAVEAALAAGTVSIQRLRDSAAVALGAAREESIAGRSTSGAHARAPDEEPPASLPSLAANFAEGTVQQMPPQIGVVVCKPPSSERSTRFLSKQRDEAAPRSPIDGMVPLPIPEPEGVVRPPTVTILKMAPVADAVAEGEVVAPSAPPTVNDAGVAQVFSPPQAPVVHASVAVARDSLLPRLEEEPSGRSAVVSPGQISPARKADPQFRLEARTAPVAPLANGSGRDSPSRLGTELPSSVPLGAPPVWTARQPRSESFAFAAAPITQEPDGLASPANAPAAPSGGLTESGPGGGDVYLDGTLLGRWISQHLAREAGRAPSGPTGFDMRRDPLLPGATVGM